MMPAIAAPSSDGGEESFPGHAMEVELWPRATNLDEERCASVSVSRMDTIDRDTCTEVSCGRLSDPDGAHE